MPLIVSVTTAIPINVAYALMATTSKFEAVIVYLFYRYTVGNHIK